VRSSKKYVFEMFVCYITNEKDFSEKDFSEFHHCT
jgi:hypothetical protein